MSSRVGALLALWMTGIVWAFYWGHYSDNRMPSVVSLMSFFDLLSHSGRILAEGLGWNLVLSCGVWLIFFAGGDVLFRWIDPAEATVAERLLISSGLGAGTVSLALLGLGLAGLWRAEILRTGYIAGIVAAGLVVYFLRRRKLENSRPQGLRESAHSPEARLDWFSQAALVLIFSALVMNLLATAAPEIFYDSLVYHLALPRLYLLRGQIAPTPENLYSGLPAAIEMLYGLALSISNEHLAILLHCSFGLVATVSVGVWLRRYSSRAGAIFGTLIFFLSPVVLSAGWQSGVDLGTAFYISLALISISRAVEMPDEKNGFRWAVISGALIGFSFGTKYTTIPLGAAFVFTHGWIAKKKGQTLKNTIWLAGIAMLAFSPWLCKNLLFYGDPLYPFFHERLGWASPAHWDRFLGDAHARNLADTLASVAGWKATFLLPWKITTDQYIDYRVSLVYLVTLPMLFTRRWGILKAVAPEIPSGLTAAVVIALLGYLAWCTTSTISRFLIPVLLLVSGAIAVAVENESTPRWLRGVVWAVALGGGLCNLTAVYLDGMPGQGLSNKWSVLLGGQSQKDYLESEHVGYGQPYYAAMEYINAQLPEKARVLFLGESRAYYCERDFIAATAFDFNPFWIAAREAKSAEELQAKLKALGITHVFLNVRQLYANAGFSAILPRETAASSVFLEFWARYLRKKFERRTATPDGQILDWLLVYELQEEPQRDAAMLRENPITETLLILKREGN